MAVATGTMPSAWELEDPGALVTVIEILQRQASAIRSARE